MFEVGCSELLLCFIVALVVLGPQKLPAVARTLGRWTGRARSYVRNLSSELERETGGATGTLKRDLESIRDDLRKPRTRTRPAPSSR